MLDRYKSHDWIQSSLYSIWNLRFNADPELYSVEIHLPLFLRFSLALLLGNCLPQTHDERCGAALGAPSSLFSRVQMQAVDLHIR